MMKQIYQYLLLIALPLIILTGCSERELTFDRTYPNLAIVDEFREKRQLELQEEIKNAPNTILETRPKPRSLIIHDLAYAHPSQYCWDPSYLECDSRMTPLHPYNNTQIDLSSLVLDSNKTIRITLDSFRGQILPYPTRIETYIYDYDKNLHLYQAVDLTDIKGFNLTLPSESKANIFLFKVFYTDEIQGIAYHPFMIVTK